MARMIDDSIKRQLSKRMDFFLKYFPVRVRDVGEDAVAARQLIWAFKDARDNAFEKVAQMTAAHLIKVCGEKIKDIVFVCVPASTQAKNESRYMAFCNRVSELCGIINGYSHISVSGDRLAVHEHRHDKEKSITKTQVIEFDEAYFKDRDIYVFDDVVTTGASYAILPISWKCLAETCWEVFSWDAHTINMQSDMDKKSTSKPIPWLFGTSHDSGRPQGRDKEETEEQDKAALCYGYHKFLLWYGTRFRYVGSRGGDFIESGTSQSETYCRHSL